MWYFWVNDVIYSNSRPRLGTRKINGGRKFSEMKVQKTWVLMFVIDGNLATYLGKTYCVRKCKKMDIENLIIAALYTNPLRNFVKLQTHNLGQNLSLVLNLKLSRYQWHIHKKSCSIQMLNRQKLWYLMNYLCRQSDVYCVV